MRNLLLIAALIGAAVAVGASEKPKNIYKIMHISPTQVGIVCQNGADPTGAKMGELLVISCGH